MQQVAATPGSSRPGCADLTCSAHPISRTPFRASAATFKSGRLCFTVDSDRAGKFSAACNNSPGPGLTSNGPSPCLPAVWSWAQHEPNWSLNCADGMKSMLG